MLGGCSPQTLPAGLVYCSEGNPETFNPQLVTSGTTIDATSQQLFNRLVEYNHQQETIVPSIAKRWHVSQDGLRYHFTLRDDVHFHQSDIFTPSRTLTADDVLFSFERIINPNHPYHFVSKTGYPFFESISFAKQIKSIEKINDLELVFHLTEPNGTFLSNLATDFAVIHSSEYAQQLLFTNMPERLDTEVIGTGPYQFQQYVKNEMIRYRRHPNYWGEAGQLPMLVFDITPMSATRLVKLITGDCSVSALPKPVELDVVELHPKLRLESHPGLNVSFWAFNTQKSPFDRLEVRQALEMAVNKQNILDAVYRDKGVIAHGLLPPASWAFDDIHVDSVYDPERAIALLKQAGISDLSLDIWSAPVGRSYNPNPNKTAELIQADLANIGVKAKIVSYGWSVFINKLNQADYDTVLIGWNADNSDPDNFFTPLLSCNAIMSSTNRSRFCHVPLESLLNQARATPSQLARKALYADAEKIVRQQVPLVSLAHAQRMVLVNDTVSHMPLPAFGGIAFDKVKQVQELQP
ncbi:ABC transporter substrate-binding protein [Shewanella sp. SNU WT4]|uniref:ABC transporter substrate-binding protein n=1 Tax=Shewanella sp. SNU WT4 TaxID=2590015 RepID=UPI001F11698D|nr:ABC transporter substrate-binding protein [Shewanella sp. SNU WT4]